MSNEVYLNHPTFGLLYQVCLLEENQEIFTTLYAQRLFFLVKTRSEHLSFDPITRSDARLLVEKRLRALRSLGLTEDYRELQRIYQRTFQ
ncbi:MAG: transcriptional coactivator PipX [Microcystaceae cyanobacterium]